MDKSEIDCVDVNYIDKFLGDFEIGRLMENIRKNQITKRITLRGNCIGPSGSSIIGDCLKEDKIITNLSIEWNQITSQGAISIAQGLETNQGLIYLDLRNNGITDDGAISLAHSLITNTTLRTLDLRWNQISDKGAIAFKDILINRKTILKLLLAGNLLTEEMNISLDIWSQNYNENNEIKIIELIPKVNTNITDITLQANNDILQKEIASLRNQQNQLLMNISDMRRQLDISAINITEMEQKYIKENYINKQLNESINNINERLSVITNEKLNLIQSWETERTHILSDTKHILLEKNSEILTIMNERDILKEHSMKSENDIIRLQLQLQELMNSSKNERELLQNDLKNLSNQFNELTVVVSSVIALSFDLI